MCVVTDPALKCAREGTMHGLWLESYLYPVADAGHVYSNRCTGVHEMPASDADQGHVAHYCGSCGAIG